VTTVRPVRAGVIPAGGLGTRFLPISRTVPKELLPVVDTAVIELVVQEMAGAGVAKIAIVIAPGKESIEAYFRPNPRLEHRLAVEFRQQDIDLLKRPERLAEIHTVVQDEAKGNGDAVLRARELVGDEPFVMLWGDDIVVADTPGAAQLVRARERLGGGSVVACIRVSKERASAYGVISGTRVDERTTRVLGIVEKPRPEEAPSGLAAVHGYVLEPEIFAVLAKLKPGRGGEIWLSDAVSQMAREGHPVWAVELEGMRYDTGDKAGYIAAFVDTAFARPDLAPQLNAHLVNLGWRPPATR
jgi:UTP--glucose-1-phosphate uridylyltransferase